MFFKQSLFILLRFNIFSISQGTSICELADSLPLRLNQIPPVRSNFHETLQGEASGEYLKIHGRDFDIHDKSKDMADFLNLQGKLEPLTIIGCVSTANYFAHLFFGKTLLFSSALELLKFQTFLLLAFKVALLKTS